MDDIGSEWADNARRYIGRLEAENARLREENQELHDENDKLRYVWVAPPPLRRRAEEMVERLWQAPTQAVRREAADLIRELAGLEDQNPAKTATRAQRCENGHACQCEFDGVLQLSSRCCVHGEADCDV